MKLQRPPERAHCAQECVVPRKWGRFESGVLSNLPAGLPIGRLSKAASARPCLRWPSVQSSFDLKKEEPLVAEELKDSGAVTALSVIGLVFGLIGMLGSFIPCLGSLAFFVGIPAAIVSGIALAIAYAQRAKRTFAIVALTISLIGVVVSGWQYFTIVSAGEKARQQMQRR